LRFRRITRQLREHNWTAIGIDFVIVVVGVFLAAQISNWDQSQKQHRSMTHPSIARSSRRTPTCKDWKGIARR